MYDSADHFSGGCAASAEPEVLTSKCFSSQPPGIGFGTEHETAPGDSRGDHPNIMLFDRRGPRQQLRPVRRADLVVGTKRSRNASDDDTPALRDIVVVGLEHHVVVDRRTDQLRSLGGAK